MGVVGGVGLNHLSLCLPAIAQPAVRESCGGGCIDRNKKQRVETTEFFFKALKEQTISFLVCKQQVMKPDHFFGIKHETQRAITNEQ